MSAQTYKIEGNGDNRFCICVKSDLDIGSIEWAQALLLLNMFLESRMPQLSAHLEEREKK